MEERLAGEAHRLGPAEGLGEGGGGRSEPWAPGASVCRVGRGSGRGHGRRMRAFKGRGMGKWLHLRPAVHRAA